MIAVKVGVFGFGYVCVDVMSIGFVKAYYIIKAF